MITFKWLNVTNSCCLSSFLGSDISMWDITSRGFNKFWHKQVVYLRRAFFLGGVREHAPPGKFWNPRLSQTHLSAFLRSIFILLCCSYKPTNLTNLEGKKTNDALFIDEKKRNMISKFDHRKLALSMSPTNVGRNRRSISLILTLGQNILLTITSWH